MVLSRKIKEYYQQQQYEQLLEVIEPAKANYSAVESLNLMFIAAESCYHLITAVDCKKEEYEQQFNQYQEKYVELVTAENLLIEHSSQLRQLLQFKLEIMILKGEFKAVREEVKQQFSSLISASEFDEQLILVIKNIKYKLSKQQLLELVSLVLNDLAGKEDSEVRAKLLNLQAEVISLSSVKVQQLQSAVDYWEESLDYYQSQLVEEQLSSLKDYILSKQKIDKFEHDAGSKITTLQDRLELLSWQVEDEELQQDLLQLYEQAEILAGIYRLVKREGPKFSFVDIERVLKEVVTSFPQLNQACLEFVGAKEEIEVDKNYFIVAVNNLIKNSLNAYQRRGLDSGRCPVQVTFDFNTWECSIADQAGGVPTDFQDNDKLFSPYVSSKEESQGGGLGLVQVKTAVELQGATIDYQSDKQGTTFTIKLAKEELE